MIGSDIIHASQLLIDGKLVAIPTETVYGLAANAFDKEAVIKIFEVKNRPFFDPLILHTNHLNKIETLTTSIPDNLYKLAEKFMPGPLTLLLPKASIVPDIVTSGLANVAVRIPNHKITLALLSGLDFPLAAPSANPFGYVSPTKAIHVENQLGSKIDYILDGGDCEIGLESTIVGMEGGKIVVYRLGGLALEEIEGLVGKVEIKLSQSSNPKAPGMLDSHYAPKKPLYIDNIQSYIENNKSKKIGVISYSNAYNFENVDNQILSKNKNLNEAAHNLFTSLRYFDNTDVDFIVAEKFPDSFLGKAINDRLNRAATK